MRFIHLSDLHLGIPLNEHRFPTKEAHLKRRLELEDAFFNLLKEPLDIDCILISGDTFDKDGIKAYFMDRFIKEASQSRVPVIMIAGNHDDFILEDATVKRFNTGSLHLLTKDCPTFTVKDTRITGFSTLDFDRDTIQKIKEENDSTYQVLLAHGDFKLKKDRYYLSSVKELEALNFDYVGLGHIHKHQFLSDAIAYAGSLEPFDFSERGEKGYIYGDLEKKTWTFTPYSQRRYVKIKLEVTADEDSNAIITRVAEKAINPQDMIRVILRGEKTFTAEPISHLKTRLEATYFVVEIRDERRSENDLERLKKEYPGSLIEVLIEESTDDDALKLALEALIESEGL